MQWTWLTRKEKQTRKRQKLASWHRKFAWLPRYNQSDRKAYWLQFIWQRVTQFHGDEYRDYNRAYVTPVEWEYRSGWHAPDVKTCPPGMEQSIV